MVGAITFANATGSGLNEASSIDNATSLQRWLYGISKGAMEYGVEKIGGIMGATGIDTRLANKLSSGLTSGIGKTLTRMGVNGLSEGAGEVVIYIVYIFT